MAFWLLVDLQVILIDLENVSDGVDQGGFLMACDLPFCRSGCDLLPGLWLEDKIKKPPCSGGW